MVHRKKYYKKDQEKEFRAQVEECTKDIHEWSKAWSDIIGGNQQDLKSES